MLNVNIPKHITKKGFAVTKLGKHGYSSEVDMRTDPRGKSYYWIGGNWSGYTDLPGTDCNAIADGYISVTPLRIKLTAERALKWVENLDVDGYETHPVYNEDIT